MITRPIDCVIHADPSVLAVWGEVIPWRERAVVVEVAPVSVIAGDCAAGVEAMAHGASVASLVVHRWGRDVIPAARTVQHPAAILAGVRRLARSSGPWRRVTALIHVDDVERFPGLFAAVERVCVAWDRSCPPGESLPGVPGILAAEGALRPETWGGFLAYDAPGATPSAGQVSLFADLARS